MHEALFYERKPGLKVNCTLCPHHCIIAPGKRGICEVRENREGTLVSLNYGIISSLSLDPIEKKPLYHFHPGKPILSLGSYGCNLQCRFCQNHEISQVDGTQIVEHGETDFGTIIRKAGSIPGNIGLAYTYNEPTVFYEMMLELSEMIHKGGLLNVMVSNGYIEKEPLERLLPFMDAFNIDLKGFTEQFYHRQTASRLEPVKETLQRIRESGKHLEVTNLVVPGLNDDEEIFRNMVDWIAQTLGKTTILHISRYFPRYKMNQPETPEPVIRRLFEVAKEKLTYVYPGNIRF